MPKSKKVVTKKLGHQVSPIEAPAVPVVVAPVEDAVVPASEPVQAEPVATTPAPAPVPTATKRARKGQAAETAVDPAAEAHARWKRRLDRWSKKAQAAGVDARALMEEALAG